MKLGRLLELHKNNQPPTSLSKNLGDGFLMAKNKIYSDVRKKTIAFGFTYSDAPNPDYLSLPLSQLESILKSRTLPFSDNVTVLIDVENRMPGTTMWDEVTDNLKKNHVFHESCHTIARTISQSLFTTETDRETEVLKLLIEESFANTCELLGIIDVEDSAHRIFYELNSYVFMYEDRTQLKKLVSELGTDMAIQFLLVCYLFSNFLHEKINESDYAKLLKLLTLQSAPAPVQKTLRSVSKIAFELNPRFRWVTTTFYLRLNGIPITTDSLSQVDFLKLLNQDQRLLKLIQNLSRFGTI